MPKLEAFEDDSRYWGGVSLPSSAAPWDAISRLAVLGVRVDTSGPAPDDRPLVYPDPDALVVNDAVLGLQHSEITMPEDWDALCDCDGLTGAERANAHRQGWAIAIPKGDRLAALIMRRAVTGRAPSWRDHGTIYRRPVVGAKGKPAWFRMENAALRPGGPAVPREVDGFNRSRKRPYPDAYRKFYLDPDPALLIAERIEYQLWALALHQLSHDLAGRLARFSVSCCVPLWPWEGESANRGRRVLSVVKSTSTDPDPLGAA